MTSCSLEPLDKAETDMAIVRYRNFLIHLHGYTGLFVFDLKEHLPLTSADTTSVLRRRGYFWETRRPVRCNFTDRDRPKCVAEGWWFNNTPAPR